MVVQITMEAGGETFFGSGLLFYAYENVDKLPSKKLAPWGDQNASYREISQPRPFVATLWHVVGLRKESSDELQNCKFFIDGRSHALSKVVGKKPMAEIDGGLSTSSDGICLLKPSGFFPNEISMSQLAIPRLDPQLILASDVSICIVKTILGMGVSTLYVPGGRPQKRGNCDSYFYAASTDQLGKGTSGGAVIPNTGITNPPPIVYGFHCGKYPQPNPPDVYIFLGTQVIQEMLEDIGYYHPVKDLRITRNGRRNLLERLINKIIPN